MSNGWLLVSAALALPDKGTRPKEGPDYGWHDIGVFYSDDLGTTWKLCNDKLRILVPQDRKVRYGAVEPHLRVLPDGRIWMLIRSQNGFLYESWSKDGVTWPEASRSKFISSDSPAGTVLLKDGRIVLLFSSCQRWDNPNSYANGGREVLHAAISSDNCKSWNGFRGILLQTENGKVKGDRGTAYPMATENSFGKVVMVSGQGEDNRKTVIFDPNWLTDNRGEGQVCEGPANWTSYGSKSARIDTTSGENILAIRRTDANDSCAATLNFTMAKEGCIIIKIKIEKDCGKIPFALTDHFSVMDDKKAYENAIYAGELQAQAGDWQDIAIAWSAEGVKVSYANSAAVYKPKRNSEFGVNYLRMHVPENRGGYLVKKATVASSLADCNTAKIASSAPAADVNVIRVACIGDSITYGYGLGRDRENLSYPAQLAKLLGSKYRVGNFGMNGVTMIKSTGRPIWDQNVFSNAIAFKPDVVIIMLGTNDAAIKDSNTIITNYGVDTLKMVDFFKGLSSKPKILLCKPCPLFPGSDDRRMRNLNNIVLPAIETTAKDNSIGLIDLKKNIGRSGRIISR